MKPLKIKKPSKFKEKIKSFFNFDIEKDLKEEEEGTKQFEKVPVFTLTRTNLFLAILLFTIIVNILVGFDINQFYIRAILGFLFLVIVPGLLIMLCFKIRTIGFWEYLVYTVGLSISFIMFAGLIVNWTLPWLGITDKPLSLWPILICFDIFLIALGITAWIRNKDLKPFQVTTPKLDLLNNIFFIIPMCFPILAILGAFLLNNHGSNILTMIMLGGIAVYVLLLTIFRKKMNENIWPWALYWMGLALLLMFSMRSWFLSGWDSFEEIYIFNLSKENLLWSFSLNMGNYNSCLSLTILPIILSNFTKILGHYIFRIFFQIIFSFTPIVIFLISKKYGNKFFSFLAGIFFITPASFFEMAQLFRQEIAFLFFSLIIFLIFKEIEDKKIYTIIFLIFGFSIIISHYSTTYIFVVLFFLSYLIWFCFFKNKSKLLNLSFVILVTLLIGTFLWHAQITTTSSNLITILDNSLTKFRSNIDLDLKGDDASLSYHFNPFYTGQDYSERLTEYIKEIPKESLNRYSPNLFYFELLPPKFGNFVYQSSFILGQIIRIFLKLAIVLGVFILLWVSFLNKKKEQEFYTLILICVFSFLLAIMVFLPALSLNYNVGRMFQQMLILLSPMGVIGLYFLSKKFNILKIDKFMIIGVILAIFLLFSSFFLHQLVGGTTGLNLNNMGQYYWDGYSNKMDMTSAIWLKQENIPTKYIYSDRISKKKLMFYSILSNKNDIFLSLNAKGDYLYLGYTNIIKKISSKNYKGYFLFFTSPLNELEDKNVIYSNGGSKILK